MKSYDNTVSLYRVNIERGKGALLYDKSGREYIDFLAGVAVNLFGHGDRDIIKAARGQMQKYIHCSRLFYNPNREKLAKQITENSFGSAVYFANSGAEASEVAIKTARKWGRLRKSGAYEIVTMKKSFHGRTIAALTATGQKKFHKNFGPMLGGFKYAEFNNIKDLDKKTGKKTAAIMLEPIQAEGGVNMPAPGYLKEAARLCKKKNILLIADEVQSGLGRTGEIFAYKGYKIRPDIMTLGKGLGGGFPLSAVVVSPKTAGVLGAGGHGTTMGGNPVACAAGNVVFKKLKKKFFLKQIEEKGKYLMIGLKSLNSPLVKEIRGKGLIVGVQVKTEAKKIAEKALRKGLVINAPQPDVIRIVPPLIITKEHIDRGISVLSAVFSETEKENKAG